MAKKLTLRQRRAFYGLIDGWTEARNERDRAITRMENCQAIIAILKRAAISRASAMPEEK